MTYVTFKLPNSIKKVDNRKLQKNTAAKTVLTAFFYPSSEMAVPLCMDTGGDSIPNAYPLPQQNEVLGAMGGVTVFSLLDMMKGFFQQQVWKEDRWKAAFSTPHYRYKQLIVTSIGLASSLGFFQAWMEQVLSKYLWKFLYIYINNIIIFS